MPELVDSFDEIADVMKKSMTITTTSLSMRDFAVTWMLRLEQLLNLLIKQIHTEVLKMHLTLLINKRTK